MTYVYDVLGRLTRETAPALGSPVVMTYDANGNCTSRTWTTTEASTIAPTSNWLTQRGAVRYGYNGNGQRSSWVQGGTTATYAYDPFNRLASTTRNAALWDGVNTYPAGTTTYQVNPLGQRVYKNGPAGQLWFHYSPGGQLLADYQTGKGWSDYIYFNGQPVALVRNNARYYLYSDHLGRPEIASNSSGATVWRASNGSFDRAVMVDSIGGLNLGFRGQYFDAETGHWYNMFRNYDGSEGRYLESDPIGLAGGVNTYAYVGGNPLVYIDPNGLVCVCAYTKALDTNAKDKSQGQCARYVRTALEAGSADTRNRPGSAKDYGSLLERNGFVEVPLEGYIPQPGDTAVFDSYASGSVNGHVQGYTGNGSSGWVSDFKQPRFWASRGYEAANLFKIYRPTDTGSTVDGGCSCN